MRAFRAILSAVGAAAGLVIVALLASPEARDTALSIIGDDNRNELVAGYSSIVSRDTLTADSEPIANTDVSPYGINVFLEQEVEEWKIRRTLEMIRDAGFHWVKQQVRWYDIETPNKGQYFDTKNNDSDTWQKYDRIVNLAQEYGLELILRLDTSPDWARPGISKEETPPSRFDDYGDFVNSVVARYKGKVKYYQIWNEPNLAFEWGAQQPSAKDYVRLLATAYRRAKEADPQCVIISAALAPTVEVSARATDDLIFLQRMYDEGAKPYFDIMGVNAYGLRTGPDDRRIGDAGDVNFSRPILVRELMVRNGDAGKAMWASEMGWNALPPDFPGEAPWGRVTREQQAVYTVRAYQRIQDEWPWMGVAALWHFRMVHDVNRSQPQYYFGIVQNDFTPYPAYEALKSLALSSSATLRPGYRTLLNPAAQFDGGWQRAEGNDPAFGSLMVTDKPGSSIHFAFRGSDLDLVVASDASSGDLTVTIDGAPYGANRLTHDADGHAVLDLWTASPVDAHSVPVARGLSWGRHEVTIVTAGGPRGGTRAEIAGVIVAGAPPNIPRNVTRVVAPMLLLLLVCGLYRVRIGVNKLRWSAATSELIWLLATFLTKRLAALSHLFKRSLGAIADSMAKPTTVGSYWERWLESRPIPLALIIGSLLLLSWLLRIFLLNGQSLWYDEGTSAALALRSVATITRDAAGDIHPPLYYYLLHFWSSLTGTSEFALRFLSVMFGLLATSTTYRLARRLFGLQVGLVASLFAGVSPIMIYYSQEARMYLQVSALALLSMLLMLKLVIDSRPRRRRLLWISYIVATAAMLYTHYFAVTILVAQNCYFFGHWLLLKGREGVEQQFSRPEPAAQWRPIAQSGVGGAKGSGQLLGWTASQAIIILLFLPWVIVAYGQLSTWPSISSPMGFLTLSHNVFRAFSFGVAWDSSYTPRRELALVILFCAAPAFLLVRRTPQWPQRAAFLALHLIIPVTAMYILSIQRPMYNPKFLLPAASAFYIIAACGVASVQGLVERIIALPGSPKRSIGRSMIVALALLFAVSSFVYPATASLRAYYFDAKYGRDDYRGLAGYISANGADGDAIILNAPGQIEIFDYYYQGALPRVGLPRQRPIDEEMTESDLQAIANGHTRIWLVLWAVKESDPGNTIEGWLDQHLTKDLDRPYGTVRLALYSIAPQNPAAQPAGKVPGPSSYRVGSPVIGD